MFPISLVQTPFPYNPDPTIPLDDWMTGPKSVVKKHSQTACNWCKHIEIIWAPMNQQGLRFMSWFMSLFWGLFQKNKHHLDLGVLYVHIHFDLFYLFFNDGLFPVFILMVFFSLHLFLCDVDNGDTGIHRLNPSFKGLAGQRLYKSWPPWPHHRLGSNVRGSRRRGWIFVWKKHGGNFRIQQLGWFDFDGKKTWPWLGCFLKWWYPQNTPKWSFLK